MRAPPDGLGCSKSSPRFQLRHCHHPASGRTCAHAAACHARRCWLGILGRLHARIARADARARAKRGLYPRILRHVQHAHVAQVRLAADVCAAVEHDEGTLAIAADCRERVSAARAWCGARCVDARPHGLHCARRVKAGAASLPHRAGRAHALAQCGTSTLLGGTPACAREGGPLFPERLLEKPFWWMT